MSAIIQPGLRRGIAVPPASKSHLHRLLIADFLAGGREYLVDDTNDAEDVVATKRCLRALAIGAEEVVLDCGESGSTMRFMAPVAAVLGKKAVFKKAGRLAERPSIEYSGLKSGLHQIEGNVSSQFVTGLLFALPLLKGDSQIRFLSPLSSRGYVEMTLDVIGSAGVEIRPVDNGFDVPGSQRYRPLESTVPEGDWSGAAFWFAANAIGNDIAVRGMSEISRQPDRRIVAALSTIAKSVEEGSPVTIDVNEFPDSFPVLTVAAACSPANVSFTGIGRLRLKESDRVAAMQEVLSRFGIPVSIGKDSFSVSGTAGLLKGGSFPSFGDHRIAMSIAVGATRAQEPVVIDNIACAAKSYPQFFEEFQRLSIKD